MARTASIVPLDTRRPPPPPDLTEAEATVWRDTVATMPTDWFGRETYHLLANYCRHVCSARWIADLINKNAGNVIKAENGVQAVDKLLAMGERESRAVLACARSLRLTQQSRYSAPTAASRAAAGSSASFYDLDHGEDDDNS